MYSASPVSGRMRWANVKAVPAQLVHGGVHTSVWPRLWLVITRAALQEANGAVTAAQRLAGWAIAYLLLAVLWWPAARLAAVTLTVAWRQAISATGTLADLVEAAINVHGRTLARSLGIRCPGPLNLTYQR